MKACIVIGKNYKFNKDDFENAYVIGVDRGAFLCYQNQIPMHMAIGDFDSITEQQFKEFENSTKIVRLNPIKDKTDTLEAIEFCKDYEDILILGGIQGNRIEHFYANLLLAEQFPNVKIKDENSFIFTTNQSIEIDRGIYKFISIFSLDKDTIITLDSFKYPLKNYRMDKLDTIGISNEFTGSAGKIILTKGRILIILSKEDSL